VLTLDDSKLLASVWDTILPPDQATYAVLKRSGLNKSQA